MGGSIFISYRRSDSAGHAKNLYDHLAQWFDAEELFFDSAHIDPGDPFPKRLADGIDSAKVVLVLVGPDWLGEINRRAVLPEPDFVRAEIELALQRQDRTGEPKVIPVLLGLSVPPSSTELHASLRTGLGALLSLEFHIFQGKNADWNNQFVRLRELIAGVAGTPVPRFRAPELEQLQKTKAGGRDSGENLVVVHARPPLVVDYFRDRLAQRQRLRELVRGASPLCAIISGRAGIGKTALLSQFLAELEQEPPAPLDFVYFSAAGSVPLSVDLLKAFLTPPTVIAPGGLPPEPPDGASPSRRRIVIALDQAELLLDADGAWCAPGVAELLRTIRAFPNVMLLIGTRTVPSATAMAGYRIEQVPIKDGLPQEDARALLLAADFDHRLGFQADMAATDAIIDKVVSNPRMLELAVAILNEDPLLTPATLARSMASYSDVVQSMLRESYASTTSAERSVLLLLAVAARPLPMQLLRACLPDLACDTEVRNLSKRHLSRVDRTSQNVQIAPLDAEYLMSASTWTPAEVRRCHIVLAEQAGELVRSGFFKGRAEDIWRLQIVEHFILGDESARASDELATSQQAGLEAHGLYDQLIRLHEKLAAAQVGAPRQRASALLHLVTLSGDKEKTLALLRRFADMAAPAPPQADCGALELEMGAAYRDLDRPRDGLHQLRLALRRGNPGIATSALSAAAQILRRRGNLGLASRVLERAIAILDGDHATTSDTMTAHALLLHQQALLARFTGHPDDAHRLLGHALRLSETAEDVGGTAYRHSLGAALSSDELALGTALASLSRAIAIYDEIGDAWGKAAALYASAQVQSDLGDTHAALDLAGKARTLARSSGNTRVDALLDGLALSLGRRSGAVDPAARGTAQRAIPRLNAAGFRFYARRVRYELELDRCLAGDRSIHDVMATLPTPGRPLETARLSHRLAALYILRPLASRLPADAKEGPGMARDAELLAKLLADAADRAATE